MDILGDGCPWIPLVVDSFTEWCETYPLQTQTAAEIAKNLHNDIVCRYGALCTLVSDHANSVASSQIEEICKLFQIDIVETNSYHPQSNSTCERKSHVIGMNLRAYVDKNQSNWPELL